MMQVTSATAFRLTQPFRIEATERELPAERRADVLLRPRLTGVCASDLKLYAGTRDRQALSKKLPLALLHEGVAEVVMNGSRGGRLRPGTRVVVVPNIPCYIAYPELYPSKNDGCPSCRPGGAGENYCLHNLYLSSNTDGLAQTYFRHPGALVVPVPNEVSDRSAALTEPLTTIAAACVKAPIKAGGRYLILGDGPLAQLVAVWLTAQYRVPRERISMTGHGRPHGGRLTKLVGAVLDATRGADFAPMRDTIDVVFECVGGPANEETLEQAIASLRPGGTAILFGPSERAVPFNTREVIGKGLVFLGSNRSFVPHFRMVIERMREPQTQQLLREVVSPEEFHVRTADDLNSALYHAWTKSDAGKTLIFWAGPE